MKLEKNTIYLIDANVIVRLLVKEPVELYNKSLDFFNLIANKEIYGIITESILMEVYFVLTKGYEIEKNQVIEKLKKLLNMTNIISDEKMVLIETLNILETKNIDFMDAYLCAKARFETLKIYSFDKDIEKCYK